MRTLSTSVYSVYLFITARSSFLQMLLLLSRKLIGSIYCYLSIVYLVCVTKNKTQSHLIRPQLILSSPVQTVSLTVITGYSFIRKSNLSSVLTDLSKHIL